MEPLPGTSRRQFMWGLSNGVVVLAVAGLFWFAIGLSLGWVGFPLAGWSAPMAAFVVLLLANRRLRRKSRGFRPSELKSGGPVQRMQAQTVKRQFQWVGAGEGLGGLVVVFACLYFRHPELISSFIALVVSIHFLPLARLFRVPAYSATGIVGSAVSLFAMLALKGFARVLCVGVGMGLVLWLSAVYIMRQADSIADDAVGPTHAVVAEA